MLVFVGPTAYWGSAGGGDVVPIRVSGKGFRATFRVPATYVGGQRVNNRQLPTEPGTHYAFLTNVAGCKVPFTVLPTQRANPQSTNSWKQAAERAGFGLLYPRSAMGLRPELVGGRRAILLTTCAGKGVEVAANWGPARGRNLGLSQTNVGEHGWVCSNAGLVGLVEMVSIGGKRAALTGYCSPAVRSQASGPMPSCSSRLVGFDLTWREGTVWINADSYGFTSRELIGWARSLRPVHQ